MLLQIKLVFNQINYYIHFNVDINMHPPENFRICWRKLILIISKWCMIYNASILTWYDLLWHYMTCCTARHQAHFRIPNIKHATCCHITHATCCHITHATCCHITHATCCHIPHATCCLIPHETCRLIPHATCCLIVATNSPFTNPEDCWAIPQSGACIPRVTIPW